MAVRLVLDTNVVASAMLWGGRPRILLHAAQDKRVQLFTSTAMLLELAEILARPKFAARITASMLTVDQLVERYALLTKVVRPIPLQGVAPDPDDDVVIATALAARAECIVTGDKPLLGVMTYQGVRIVGVGKAVERIEARNET